PIYIYTLSLHDALPIWKLVGARTFLATPGRPPAAATGRRRRPRFRRGLVLRAAGPGPRRRARRKTPSTRAAYAPGVAAAPRRGGDRKSTRLNSSHVSIS